MTESGPPAVGAIAWVDLTVADAPGIRDFCTAVRAMGKDARYAVIRDPAGAIAALYQRLV